MTRDYFMPADVTEPRRGTGRAAEAVLTVAHLGLYSDLHVLNPACETVRRHELSQ